MVVVISNRAENTSALHRGIFTRVEVWGLQNLLRYIRWGWSWTKKVMSFALKRSLVRTFLLVHWFVKKSFSNYFTIVSIFNNNKLWWHYTSYRLTFYHCRSCFRLLAGIAVALTIHNGRLAILLTPWYDWYWLELLGSWRASEHKR